MNFNTISILPEMFAAITEYGITGRAFKQKIYTWKNYNPRDYTNDIHKTIDDRPYGGGPGMVMMYQPIKEALESIKKSDITIYMSPQGQPLTHKKVVELAQLDSITILCGRYEGVDQRVIDNLVDQEISIGDYVLSGGEIPAMSLMDSIIRQIPKSLGNQESAEQDSFNNQILDCPHYTRPETIDNLSVPKILLSGNHLKIEQWREKQALAKTTAIRPDLILKNKQELI